MDKIYHPTQTTCMMCVDDMYRRQHYQTIFITRAGQIRSCRASVRTGRPMAGTKPISGSVTGPLAGGIYIQYLAVALTEAVATKMLTAIVTGDNGRGHKGNIFILCFPFFKI